MSEDPPPVAMRRRVITTIVVIVVFWMGARFGFKALKNLRETSARTATGQPPPMVRAERAVRQDYVETLRGYGRARPLQRADVVAEVAGLVREVSPLLEAGTAIEAVVAGPTDGAAGADALPVLVRLDTRDLDDRVTRAQAELEAAEAEIARLETVKSSLVERGEVAQEELDAAARELRRIAGLVPNTLTPSDLDRQQLQVSLRRQQLLQLTASLAENDSAAAAALARLKARQADVDLARRDRERADVRPPFPGRIEQRLVDEGEHVRVGDPLFSIVNLAALEVPVALSAARYADVARGASAALSISDEVQPRWTGTVVRVAPGIESGDRTFYAYVVVQGSPTENPIPPGSHLLARIEGRTYRAVVPVPRQAFLGERVFVARPEADGKTALVEERRPTVVRSLAGVALVTKGLEEGDLFLVTNLESVADGSRVRLAPEAPEPAPAAPPGEADEVR